MTLTERDKRGSLPWELTILLEIKTLSERERNPHDQRQHPMTQRNIRLWERRS